jgi:hypothetical protein
MTREERLERQRAIEALERPERETWFVDGNDEGQTLYFWADGLVTWKPARP